ncbi:MAG: histidinol-phosphate transaminase [Microscillaceae bacterium]|jgi:histidinol-phosphate aminotransferase|nr:histidinol-phosphate transaminase [Microscillaceae bacterium]
MNFDLNALLRPNIQNLKPYSSARDEFSGTASVFLDANENPYGSAGHQVAYNRYPDPLQQAIKTRLAELEGLSPQQIFLGNGSDEAIDLLIRAFCEPHQDHILLLPPTYGMYKVSADINAVDIVEVPLTSDFQVNRSAVLAKITAKTKIIFLCSPNNPSANLLNHTDIEAILQNFLGLVVIDEAYIDFCPRGTSWVNRLNEFPNLVILKTLSKAWGLAGLRLGMALAHEDIIQIYNRIKPPYNINLATQQLVLQALENVAWKDEMVTEILKQREILRRELAQLPQVLKIYPSDANFLLVKVSEPYRLYDYLVEQEIIVRQRANVMLCDGCLRITVGTPTENQALLVAWRNF